MRMTQLQAMGQLFESHLERTLNYQLTPLHLLEVMTYALKSGGKRLRPILLLLTIAINDPDLLEKGLQTATALEYIHTYSLIHDDLPAMDNDDLRRGQPTCHKKFGQAAAILAGDALLTDAFALISEDDLLSPAQKVTLISRLSKAAGSVGMVAGQMGDIKAEEKSVDLTQLKAIHAAKTGALFSFAIDAAAIICQLEPDIADQLHVFSLYFGQAYQIHNDLMDVVGNLDTTGKVVHADAHLNKSTYPSLLGLKGAYAALNEQVNSARSLLKELSQATQCDYMALEPILDFLHLEIEEA